MLTFAVGDIHGCYEQLLMALRKVSEVSDGEPARVVFLGDYVDRGPSSAQVVAHLMRGPDFPNQEWVCLQGNHDQMFADHVLGSSDYHYLAHWGAHTLSGYPEGESDAEARQHAKWLRSLPAKYEDQWRYYAHAGMMPGVPFEKQDREALTWIRGEFLHADYDFGKRVIHGHTPAREIEVTKYRTNLDTGCCFGRKLSMACWPKGDESEVVFFSFPNEGAASA